MTSASTYSRLAAVMCGVTEQVLWRHWQPDIHKTRPRARLQCRTGSGRATYHRYDHRRQFHQITYGVRMVAAKHDPQAAAGWLSTREILQRGYFAGEVSILNLLAHTCTHEFAHLLQQHGGKRYYGSVHNHHFYQLLDELNNRGWAERVRTQLIADARSQGLKVDDLPMGLPDRNAQAREWAPGDHVCFGEGGAAREGAILRVNRKTCTVEGLGPCRGQRYRVPFVMLRTMPAPTDS